MFCLSASAFAAAIDKTPTRMSSVTIPISGHGDLNLRVPPEWSYSVRYPGPAAPPTIKFGAAGNKMTMLITAAPLPEKNKDFNSPAKTRSVAGLQLKQMLPSAKETAVDLVDIKGDKAAGTCFTLTDKAPNPGSFECMTSAFVGTGNLLLGVTILHHEKNAPEQIAAIEVLKSASQSPLAKPAMIRMNLGGEKQGTLSLPAGGLALEGMQYDAAHKAYQLIAEDHDKGLIVSIFAEPAPKPGDAVAVRDLYWGRAQKSPIEKEGITLGKSGELATVQYMVPAAKQKNMNLYAVQNGVWIDVHISKVDFAQADQALFDQIAGGLKFEKIETKK
jgi:hypothetical protein